MEFSMGLKEQNRAQTIRRLQHLQLEGSLLVGTLYSLSFRVSPIGAWRIPKYRQEKQRPNTKTTTMETKATGIIASLVICMVASSFFVYARVCS
jgi:hypothetical protein